MIELFIAKYYRRLKRGKVKEGQNSLETKKSIQMYDYLLYKTVMNKLNVEIS